MRFVSAGVAVKPSFDVESPEYMTGQLRQAKRDQSLVNNSARMLVPKVISTFLNVLNPILKNGRIRLANLVMPL